MNNRLLISQKSPSLEAMKRTATRTTLNGGLTVDFSANTQNIRDLSNKLGYNVFNDATIIYTPASYSELKNYLQNPAILKNLTKYSEQINNAFWTQFGATVSPDFSTNPIDGLNTADKIIPITGASMNHRFHNTTLLVTGNTYNYSVYAKASGYQFVNFQIGGIIDNLFFDLINGIIVTGSGAGVPISGNTKTITDVGNGWYRCSAIAQNVINTTVYTYVDSVATVSGSIGDGVSGVLVWGTQLTLGTALLPYQSVGDGITDFNFSRTTIATATNKDGSIGDNCYNLLQNSEDFRIAAIWKSDGGDAIAINNILSPIGTMTGNKITEGTANNYHDVYQPFNTVANQLYTYSVYAKAAERNFFEVAVITGGFGNGASCVFDLSAGTNNSGILTFGNASNASALITNAGNGWYQCSVTVSFGANYGAYCINLMHPTSVRGQYSGTTGMGLYLWGAQLNYGTTILPYFRTTNRFNIGRLDYTLSSIKPSLFLEGAKTNYCFPSEDFTPTGWTKTLVTLVTNAIVAPNNVNNGTKIRNTAVSGLHSIYFQPTFVSGSTYAISCYVKMAEYTRIGLRIGGGGYTTPPCLVIDLSASTVEVAQGFTTYSYKLISNGWYRISATFVAQTQVVFNIGGVPASYTVDGTGQFISTGDGVSGIYIWGAQFESANFVSSYIPTIAAAANRNSESNYIDLWNGNLLNQNNFTLFFDYLVFFGGSAANSIGVSSLTTGNAPDHLSVYTAALPIYRTNNVQTTVGTVGVNNTVYRVVIQRNGTSVKWFRNGVQLGVTQTIPVTNYRYLIVNDGGTSYSLNKIALFNRTLSDAECINLTT